MPLCSGGMVTEAKAKTAVFSDIVRNRNCGFPVMLDGRFQKLTVVPIWCIDVDDVDVRLCSSKESLTATLC